MLKMAAEPHLIDIARSRDGGTRFTERPVVACYCATFLKPEMLHIYRQITSLTRVSPIVIAQKREEAERYPFDRIAVVDKPAMHFARRFWFKQVRGAPWQISRREVNTLAGVLGNARAKLLHIYFGHIAVHLLPLICAWKKPSVPCGYARVHQTEHRTCSGSSESRNGVDATTSRAEPAPESGPGGRIFGTGW